LERKAVLKWLKIFNIVLFLVSVIELLDFILFSSLITLNLDGSQYSIFNVIFQSGFMTAHAILLWFFLLCVISSFMVLSIVIFMVAKKIENHILAKFLLLIGLFFIIGGFIKTSFVFLLGNSNIHTTVTPVDSLINALYNPSVAPTIIGAIMWYYTTVAISFTLVSGLVFGGIGLKWMLLIQEEKETNEKN